MIGSFDRIGFRVHRLGFKSGDLDADLGGRCALVTGANSGLGKATALALAQRGAEVRMLCRNQQRGHEARDEIRRITGNKRVEVDVVDMSDQDSVRRFVGGAGLSKVDILVHNAGSLPSTRVLTPQGLELTFATHVVGPHLLTRLLEGPLRAGAESRVIFVSSGGMYTQPLRLEDLAWETRAYDGVVAYAQTKRMQVVLARAWAGQFAGSHVSLYSMHPGWADTAGVRSSLPRFHKLTSAILRTAEEGADTIVWLAVRQPAPGPGGFWFDRKERPEHLLPWTKSREDQEQAKEQALWNLCQQLTDHKGDI